MKRELFVMLILTTCYQPFVNSHPQEKDYTLVDRMLKRAVKHYDTAGLHNALHHGANPNLRLTRGTILHRACTQLYYSGAKRLITEGASLEQTILFLSPDNKIRPARALECVLWRLYHEHNYRMSRDPDYAQTPPSPTYKRFLQARAPLITLLAKHYRSGKDNNTLSSFYDTFITKPGVPTPHVSPF